MVRFVEQKVLPQTEKKRGLEDGETDELFGKEYVFSMGEAVIDVPEFLVHRSAFEFCANENGLKVCSWTPFRDYFYKAMQDEVFLELAQKMKVIDSNGHSIDPHPLAWETAQLYVVVELIKE